MAEPRPKRVRPENPKQTWANQVASKYYDLVPPEHRATLDDLYKGTNAFWKAKDMSAKGTARALCMGAEGMAGIDKCSRPFDASLRVSYPKEHATDATRFFGEAELPRPGQRRTGKATGKGKDKEILARAAEVTAALSAPPAKRTFRRFTAVTSRPRLVTPVKDRLTDADRKQIEAEEQARQSTKQPAKKEPKAKLAKPKVEKVAKPKVEKVAKPKKEPKAKMDKPKKEPPPPQKPAEAPPSAEDKAALALLEQLMSNRANQRAGKK